MDELICYTTCLPEHSQKDISFLELLLDDNWANGRIEYPETLPAEIGGINYKLTAKRNYEFLLRAVQKYPFKAIGVSSAPVSDHCSGSSVNWDSYRTDAYIAGKYQKELLSSGYFNPVIETLLNDASCLPNPKEASAWLEQMISRTDAYYDIDDYTRPVLIYRGSDTCYNTLNQFADELTAALRSCGQPVEVFDVEKEGNQALTRYIGCHFKAIIGIQTYVFSIMMQDNKTNLHDLITGPKYNLILDHPAWLKEHIEHGPADYYLLTHDRNYCAFARHYYKNIKDCLYFPPAGILPKQDSAGQDTVLHPQTEKQYDITFIGSYRDYRERLAAICSYDRTHRFLSAHYIHRMRQYPNETAEQSLRHTLNGYGIKLNDHDFLNLFFELRQACFCIMLYFREKVIRTLLDAGIDIHVYSESWRKSPFADHPCLHCHPALNMEESLDIMQKSRISLNIMSWHKDGLTERVLNSMLCHSVVLSDRSVILEEEFTDKEDLILFDLKQTDLLPSQIKELLADDSRLEQLADRSYKKAMQRHLWHHRAEQLLAILHTDIPMPSAHTLSL